MPSLMTMAKFAGGVIAVMIVVNNVKPLREIVAKQYIGGTSA